MAQVHKDNRKKMQARITAVGFSAMVILAMMLCILTPDKVFSENENRGLAQKPELSMASVADGAYMKQFEKYASDTVAGRDMWVSLKTGSDLAMGKKDNGQVYFGKDGYLFQIQEIDKEQLKKNIAYLDVFFQKIRKQHPHMKVSMIVAPTSGEIMDEFLPKYAPVADEADGIDRVKHGLGNAVCDVTPALREKRDQAVYYRTDHHWTTLGAYYAYEAWAAAQGMTTRALADYEKIHVADDFYGTLHSKANLKMEPDIIQRFDLKTQGVDEPEMKIYTKNQKVEFDSLYDAGYLEGKDKYAYFLSGNNPLTVIEGGGGEPGKTLLIIKDSYAHCFIPFLTEQFQRIVAVDLRYYKESAVDLLEDYEVTDVMVLYNIVGFSNDRNLVYLKGE